jgi:Rod binding domain-containing protein
MAISPIFTAAPAAAAAPPDAKPKSPAEAATQFEGILIAQMLKSVREERDQEDSTGSSMLDMADQQFSKVLADNGGLGLSKLIVKSMNK